MRSRQVLTFRRNRCGTRSPGADPRAGLGASGSKKCATNASAPSVARQSASSATITACRHDINPEASAAATAGIAQTLRDWLMNAAAAPGLSVRTPATSAVVDISTNARSEPCGVRRRHRLLKLRELRGVPGFTRRDLGFQLLPERQPLQPKLRLPLQHINRFRATASGSARSSSRVLQEQRVEAGDRGPKTLHHRCSRPPRFP